MSSDDHSKLNVTRLTTNANGELGTGTHLWEIRHPYQFEDYGLIDSEFPDLTSFLDNYRPGDGFDELNLLFRWDWRKPGYPYSGYETYEGPEKLDCVFVLQRKARIVTTSVPVTERDESVVRDWLERRSHDIAAIWCPVLPRLDASRCTIDRPIDRPTG